MGKISRNIMLQKELSRETDFAIARIISIVGKDALRIRHQKSADVFQYLSMLLTNIKHKEEVRRVHYDQQTDPQSVSAQLVNRLLSHSVVSQRGSREFPLSKVLFEHLKMLTALRYKELNNIALNDDNMPRNVNITSIAPKLQISGNVNIHRAGGGGVNMPSNISYNR